MIAKSSILSMPRLAKRAVAIGNDVVLLTFALWAAFSLRLDEIYWPDSAATAMVLFAAPLIAVAIFYRFGVYRIVTRHVGPSSLLRILLLVSLSVFMWTSLVFLAGSAISAVPRSVIIIYWFLATPLILASRQAAAWYFSDTHSKSANACEKKSVLIYGAGTAGIQLLEELKHASGYKPVCFVDEDASIWNQKIHSCKIYPPVRLEELVRRDNIREIFLVMPEAPRHLKREIIENIGKIPLPVVVKTLPSMSDIASGKVQVSDLRPIEVEDLLGREPVLPDPELMSINIKNRVVMVSGAGGSIGSELCRQIIAVGPEKLVLFERSEPALYHLDNELEKCKGDTEIVSVLGSVLDDGAVRRVIGYHGVEAIYHAAAYKHVPMVEVNPIAGIKNNTFGTITLAKAAKDLGIKSFVLISTDKAVNPTNIMGASKRLAEMFLQVLSKQANKNETVFSMVRFGNVLDSSGSVVRTFRRQIKAGGPITVTHKDIIRYFMSIPEAAQLVIQAGGMAKGGEVFVLDMGSPVKIDDMARTMIRLAGLKVCDDKNPDGDIGIEYIGLRPGEKLYEELLIGENSSITRHAKKIMQSNEPHPHPDILQQQLSALEAAMSDNNVPEIIKILHQTVEGYTPDTNAITP
jgi:FlaA1/EpsC-like NDP-sugar epimerase